MSLTKVKVGTTKGIYLTSRITKGENNEPNPSQESKDENKIVTMLKARDIRVHITWRATLTMLGIQDTMSRLFLDIAWLMLPVLSKVGTTVDVNVLFSLGRGFVVEFSECWPFDLCSKLISSLLDSSWTKSWNVKHFFEWVCLFCSFTTSPKSESENNVPYFH